MISHRRLLSLLSYDKETGLFMWKASRRGGVLKGDVAGYLHPKNGVVIGIDSIQYYGHRLAWFYVTGRWPKRQIDHRDLNRGNNKWTNLREATWFTNNRNVGLKSHNTTGAKGVSVCKTSGRYVAYINANKVRFHLGRYDDLEEAARAYDAAAVIHHGEFARLNFPEDRANG